MMHCLDHVPDALTSDLESAVRPEYLEQQCIAVIDFHLDQRALVSIAALLVTLRTTFHYRSRRAFKVDDQPAALAGIPSTYLKLS